MPRLLQYSDIENVYDDPARAGRLAGRLRALDGEDALVVGTGDNTSPGVLALVERGRQSLDFFSTVDADLETFGNHDFDYGPEETRTLVDASPQTWVSANVYEEGGDSRFASDAGALPLTLRAVDGATVGFFGLTDPATASLNPQAASLVFGDPIPAAREATATLRERGADYVVALSHLGAGDDHLAAAVDVDAVLGGHVHSTRLARVDGIPCTRPGVNGEAVVEVDLAAGTASLHETADSAPVESLVESLRGRVEAAGLDEVLTTVAEPMERTHEVVFGGECRIGNAVADAYRWETAADVGLQNSGGIRSGPPLHGAVTTADMMSVIPFEEHVVLAEVSGAELVSLFEEARGANLDFGEPDWWHGHVSGAELVFADGLVDARVGGEPVDPERRYTIGTSEYLLHTDHEFPTLGPRHRAGEFGIQYEVLCAYARTCGLDVEVEGRLVHDS